MNILESVYAVTRREVPVLFVLSLLTSVASPYQLSLLPSGLSVKIRPRCLWGSTFVAMETD